MIKNRFALLTFTTILIMVIIPACSKSSNPAAPTPQPTQNVQATVDTQMAAQETQTVAAHTPTVTATSTA